MNKIPFQKERENNRAELTHITISTRVPSKWRFVDLETDQVWKWEHGKFKSAQDISVETIGKSPASTRDKEERSAKEQLEHIFKDIIEPMDLVKKLNEGGVKVEIGMVYTGDEAKEGWGTVTCKGCGATALMPEERVKEMQADDKVIFCPECQKEMDKKKP